MEQRSPFLRIKGKTDAETIMFLFYYARSHDVFIRYEGVVCTNVSNCTLRIFSADFRNGIKGSPVGPV